MHRSVYYSEITNILHGEIKVFTEKTTQVNAEKKSRDITMGPDPSGSPFFRIEYLPEL